MADSEGKGLEEAAAASRAEEAAGKRKSLAAQNAIILTAQVADHEIQPLNSPEAVAGAVRNQTTPILIKVRSARLETAPEIAPDDLAPAKRARSVSPNYVQAPPALAPLRNFAVAATGSPSSSSLSIYRSSTPSTSQNPARPRTKPTSKSLSPRSRAYIFGSCFGGPTVASPSGKLPSQVAARKLQPSPSIRRVPSKSDTHKPGVHSTEAERKSLTVSNSTTNFPTTASTLVAEVEATAPSAGAAPKRSPSCTCSISTTQAENAGRTEGALPLEPGAIAGVPASMSNVDTNNPGNSSGQQVLNAQAEELIAAVKRADEAAREAEEPRISDTRPSPIRGLRPNPGPNGGLRTRGRLQRSDSESEDRSADRRARGHSPFEGRSRSPHNYNYNPGRVYPPRDRRGRRERYAPPIPNVAPKVISTGIDRLFDAILGRGDYYNEEQAAPSRSPNRFRRSRPRSSPNRRRVEQQIPGEQQTFDAQIESPRDPKANSPGAAEPSSLRDQASSNQALKSPDSNTRNFTEVETSNRDQYSGENSPDQAGNYRGQANKSGTFVDARAALDVQDPRQDQQREANREAKLLASDYVWKKKDPYREVIWRTTPKEPRQRGYPDPSFNPRPGDIIIRARKRAGLRLTDFYYYDNENYMEQGDQIIRAKFEYMPPNDKMYLWCRLYVYGADGTYTYLDSTSERVGKFRTEPDIKNFKDPARFL